ncbi:hypothetical protein GJ496_004368 [Pomphorhynchus laevis]|nr:hypothetical protein GJ496_004368 [Pomphorhynchus laevis]
MRVSKCVRTILSSYSNAIWRYSQSARFLSILKFALIVCVAFEYNYFGDQMPDFYKWMLANKIYSCFFVFFIGNSVESLLMSTGAFEIYVNDMPIWSKLQSGRFPSTSEILQALENNRRLLMPNANNQL